MKKLNGTNTGFGPSSIGCGDSENNERSNYDRWAGGIVNISVCLLK